MRGQDP